MWARSPAGGPFDLRVGRPTGASGVGTALSTRRCTTDDPLTDIAVQAGDAVTFDFLGTSGGGVPRVFLQFDNATSPGENTVDTRTCTQVTDNSGTVSYTITRDGTITAFAAIHDRDNGSTTYSNLVIAGTRTTF